jgi:DNA-binding transcriptional regulator PaaX
MRNIKNKSHSFLAKGYNASSVLEEVSTGDTIVGFLLSAHSTSRMFKVAQQRAKARHKTHLTIQRLEKEGLISFKKNDRETLQITASGRKALELLKRGTRATHIVADRKQKWDGKWHMVTFDIPEAQRSVRDSLRYLLKGHHWFQIQKSIWVYPYESSDFIEQISEDPTIKKCLLYGVLSSINQDRRARDHFKIS